MAANLPDPDSIVNAPIAPGDPDQEPSATAEVWRQRLAAWLADLTLGPFIAGDRDPAQLAHLTDEDRSARDRALAWVAASPVPAAEPPPIEMVEAVGDARGRLYPDGRVTEGELLQCFMGLTHRVGCPACGGYQVYELAEVCGACGGSLVEDVTIDPEERSIVSRQARAAADVEYERDHRYQCASLACVRWGTACSRCGGQSRDRSNACAACRAPWPRTRTRWRFEPKGACGGKDPYENRPDLGCGWRAA